MPQLRIGLRDLEGLPSGSLEVKGPSLEKWVREYFSFLPHPLGVEFDGDEVMLTYPDETDAAQAEAARLAGKAAKRAGEGNYDKAIANFKRVLELKPDAAA